MSNYTQLQQDFIERTIALLEQYDEIVLPSIASDQEYHTTLLINCMLGMLIMPHEYNYDWLPKVLVKDLDEEWGIKIQFVEKYGILKQGKPPYPDATKDTLDLQNLVRQMRNSIAHIGFDSDKKDKQIEIIIFGNRNKKFFAKIPVKTLRKFTEKLAKTLLDKIQAEKT